MIFHSDIERNVLAWVLEQGVDPNMACDSTTTGVPRVKGTIITYFDATVRQHWRQDNLELLYSYGGKITVNSLFFCLSRTGYSYPPNTNWLIDHGADVNLDIAGRGSVLHFAIRRNAVDMVRVLLERGADVFHREDVTGRNALEVAESNVTPVTKER